MVMAPPPVAPELSKTDKKNALNQAEIRMMNQYFLDHRIVKHTFSIGKVHDKSDIRTHRARHELAMDHYEQVPAMLSFGDQFNVPSFFWSCKERNVLQPELATVYGTVGFGQLEVVYSCDLGDTWKLILIVSVNCHPNPALTANSAENESQW